MKGPSFGAPCIGSKVDTPSACRVETRSASRESTLLRTGGGSRSARLIRCRERSSCWAEIWIGSADTTTSAAVSGLMVLLGRPISSAGRDAGGLVILAAWAGCAEAQHAHEAVTSEATETHHRGLQGGRCAEGPWSWKPLCVSVSRWSALSLCFGGPSLCLGGNPSVGHAASSSTLMWRHLPWRNRSTVSTARVKWPRTMASQMSEATSGRVL